MPNYDFYEAYREPLTEDDEIGIREAEERRVKMLAGVEKGDLRRAEDGIGFIDPKQPDVYLPDPVIAEHMGIAMNRAQEQFQGWPAMPEDPDIMLRFPGMDPMGKYGLIDLKFAQREARIRAALATRPPELRQYAEMLLRMGVDGGEPNPVIQNLRENLKPFCERHRVVTRAAKLCLDPYGRELLAKQARVMEEDDAVRLYDLYLQGVEYAAGVRKGHIPHEVLQHYEQYMQWPLHSRMIDRVNQEGRVNQTPDEINVDFQNLEHRVIQAQFANPHNWGKMPAQLDKNTVTLDVVANMVPPYARATADRALKPLFQDVETKYGNIVSRGDLIIIDGQTVREKMFETFMANGGDDKQFHQYYEQNYRQQTNEYVAAALMAGKRVETFVPDKDGRISMEPVQITKTGYEPKALQPVLLNAWERFWSKRGFYKEKTAQAAEYQRMVEARERVQAANFHARLELDGGAQPHVKAPYLRDWVRQHGPDLDGGPYRFSVTRSAVTSISVCALLKEGKSMEDIFDPNKLLDEKARVGKEVLQRMKDGDQSWLGEQMFHGQWIIADYIDQKAMQTDLLNPRELYQDGNEILFFAAHTAFDVSQEKDRVKAGYQEAAERYAPGNGPAAARETDTRALNVGAYFDSAGKSLAASITMAGGMGKNLLNTGLSPITTFEAFRQKHSANSTQPMSRRMDERTCLGLTMIGQPLSANQVYQAVARQVERSVEAQKAFGRDMLAGRMQSRLQITADTANFRFDFQLTAPAKEAAKQAENDRQLQATDRQNQQQAQQRARNMGGPGR